MQWSALVGRWHPNYYYSHVHRFHCGMRRSIGVRYVILNGERGLMKRKKNLLNQNRWNALIESMRCIQWKSYKKKTRRNSIQDSNAMISEYDDDIKALLSSENTHMDNENGMKVYQWKQRTCPSTYGNEKSAQNVYLIPYSLSDFFRCSVCCFI